MANKTAGKAVKTTAAQSTTITQAARILADALNKQPKDSDGYKHVGIAGTEIPGVLDKNGNQAYRLYANMAPDGNIFPSWNTSMNPRSAMTKGLKNPEKLERFFQDRDAVMMVSKAINMMQPPTVKTEAPKPKQAKETGVKLW